MSRKIILNLAMSLDGYISKQNGGFDWIIGYEDNNKNTTRKFNFNEFVDNIDIIVMGRKAFEDCGVTGYENKKIIVLTSQNMDDYDNIKFINGDICKYVNDLKKMEGKDIWLFGGRELTDNFIKEDFIDKYIIGIIPIMLGSGRKLFLQDNPTIKLHLDECTIENGITILQYSKRINKIIL